MIITGLGIEATVFSASGLPSVDINALQSLAGNPSKEQWGTAYDHFV